MLPDCRAAAEDCRRWVREVTVLGQPAIMRSEVHFYELCLAAQWYREALGERGSEQTADVSHIYEAAEGTK